MPEDGLTRIDDEDLAALFGGDAMTLVMAATVQAEQQRVDDESAAIEEVEEEDAEEVAQDAANDPGADPGRTSTDLDNRNLGAVASGAVPDTIFDGMGDAVVGTVVSAAERQTIGAVAVDTATPLDAFFGEVEAQESNGAGFSAMVGAAVGAVSRNLNKVEIAPQRNGIDGVLAGLMSVQQVEVIEDAQDATLNNRARFFDNLSGDSGLRNQIERQVDEPDAQGAQGLRDDLNKVFMDANVIRGEGAPSGALLNQLFQDEAALANETGLGVEALGTIDQVGLKARVNEIDGVEGLVDASALPGDLGSVASTVSAAQGIEVPTDDGTWSQEMQAASMGETLAQMNGDAGGMTSWSDVACEEALDLCGQPDLFPEALSGFALNALEGDRMDAAVRALSQDTDPEYVRSPEALAFGKYPGIVFYPTVYKTPEGMHTPAMMGLPDDVTTPSLVLDLYPGGMSFGAACAVQQAITQKLAIDPRLDGMDAVAEFSQALGQVAPNDVSAFTIARLGARNVPAWAGASDPEQDRADTMMNVGLAAGIPAAQILPLQESAGLVPSAAIGPIIDGQGDDGPEMGIEETEEMDWL